MRTIGRKKSKVAKVVPAIAGAVINLLKKVWESDMLARIVVYAYVLVGFMLVVKVLVLGA